MMKKWIACMMATFLIFACVACGSQSGSQDDQGDRVESVELVVAAAASLTDVTKELADLYKTVNPNVTLTFTYGASGALQTQIEEGAPTDIFISAAQKQMNALAEAGLLASPSEDLLINRIVLITPADSTSGIESFADCGTDKVKNIAFGDPATTPAGQYGQEIFTGLGILDEVNAKANLGSDVRQVLTWVEMGEVDCGVVFMTDALTSDQVTVVATAEDGTHTPAVYPIGIIDASQSKDAAQDFVDFLHTDAAKAVFENSGFSMAD